MWLFDVLVLLLLVLLCGLLWMGWQFKIYIGKLKAQEARFAELEVPPRCQQRALCAVEFKQSGTRCAFICGLIAVCCTKRIASIFKDLE